MTKIFLDNYGYPILFADVPNSGTATVDADARGGNPRHDSSSGKFSSGSRKPEVSQAQINIDPEQLRLKRDAVRDAARQFDEMTGADLQEFLAGRVQDLTLVDFDAFLLAVREQRLDDLADILEDQIRSSVSKLTRGRRQVKVKAPRGYSKRVFSGLTDEEVVSLAIRMERRGMSEGDVRDNIISRIKDESRRTLLENEYGTRSVNYRVR